MSSKVDVLVKCNNIGKKFFLCYVIVLICAFEMLGCVDNNEEKEKIEVEKDSDIEQESQSSIVENNDMGMDEETSKDYIKEKETEIIENELNVKVLKYKKSYIAGKLSAINEYDKSGNEIKEIQYDIGTGEEKNVIEKIYDANGNMITKKTNNSYEQYECYYEYEFDDSDGSIKIMYEKNAENICVCKYVYEYDTKGNQTIIKKCYDDGSMETYECSYNNFNDIIREVFKKNYKYEMVPANNESTNGYLTPMREEKVLLAEDEIITEFEYRYEYDSNGNKLTMYYENWFCLKYEYDENGNIIKEFMLSNEGEISILAEYIYTVK